jgi:hypothetical protein
MKLIEVVVLMGAQCISPVQHSQAVTEAAKVECAVVVEKDTDAGTVKVLPPSEADNPKVVAVLQRFKTENVAARMRIEPASAPPALQQASTPRKPLELAAPIAPPETAAADTAETDAIAEPAAPVATADAVESDAVEAAPEKPVKRATKSVAAAKTSDAKHSPPKAKVVRSPQKQPQKTAQKAASQCAASAVQKWYSAGDGRKKYRCVRPGKEADAKPTASKLY